MQVMDWDLIGSDDPLGDVCVQLSFLREQVIAVG